MFDGVNEKGLAGGTLYFHEYADFLQPSQESDKAQIPALDFLHYALGSCFVSGWSPTAFNGKYQGKNRILVILLSHRDMTQRDLLGHTDIRSASLDEEEKNQFENILLKLLLAWKSDSKKS